MQTTMIQIKKETASKLKEMKKFERESYDDVINTMINEYEAEQLTDHEIKEIEEGLEDIKQGRVQSIESVAKELGVKLGE